MQNDIRLTSSKGEEQVQTGQSKESANFVIDVSHEVNEETDESKYTEEGDYQMEDGEELINIGNIKETGQTNVKIAEKSEQVKPSKSIKPNAVNMDKHIVKESALHGEDHKRGSLVQPIKPANIVSDKEEEANDVIPENADNKRLSTHYGETEGDSLKQTERPFQSTEKSEDIKLDANDQGLNEIDIPDQIKTNDPFESGKVSNETNSIDLEIYIQSEKNILLKGNTDSDEEDECISETTDDNIKYQNKQIDGSARINAPGQIKIEGPFQPSEMPEDTEKASEFVTHECHEQICYKGLSLHDLVLVH
ncbi:hypothetical protein ACTXT7_011291 [Hymenolepis weldensis]